MLKLVDTRWRNGHSRYGPPPVAVFEMRPARAPDAPDFIDRLRSLQSRGLLPAAFDEETGTRKGMAGCFGLLVSELLEHGGHYGGTPQIEMLADGNLSVNLPCEEPETAASAAGLAARLLFGPAEACSADEATLEAFFNEVRAHMPHPDTRRIIRAARECGLPVMRLDQDPFETSSGDRPFRSGLIQIGHGTRRRVLAGAMPSLDPNKLMLIASRERLVPHLLEHGLPLPPQDLEFPNKNRASRAVQAAQRLGGPVAVRAIDRESFANVRQYTSVFEPLTEAHQIIQAFQAVSTGNRRVWVEAHVGGKRVRCLVIGGALVAATCSAPPTITGDGRHSVAELLAEAVRAAGTPRLRHAWKTLESGDLDVRTRLSIAGIEPYSVPESGQKIPLRGEGTALNGGRLDDVLALLSTSIRNLAERIVAVCGLEEIAAVDLAVVDLRGDASPPNCHVLDVVPDPDLLSHIECRLDGGGLAERLVETLFPPGRRARIPTVAITGTNGKTTTSRMTAAILRRAYRQVGLATTEGAFVNDDRLIAGDVAGVAGAALVLADDRVQAAVLETARGGVHKAGTAVEVCDAAACLNIASDHVGVDGITSLDELAAIKRRVLELADGYAVINADDPRCLAMLGKIQRALPILVSRDPESSAVREHLACGGKAVLIARSDDGEESLVLARGTESEHLLRTHEIPAVMNGLLPLNAQNAAFAAALCWSLGVDAALIGAGLRQFSNSVRNNPGRYNFIEGYPFTLVTDFAQNAHGLAELYPVIGKLAHTGKVLLVCLTIGSRHREHIDENAHALVEHFDHLIIGCSDYADSNPQYTGDNPREIMLAHFRQQLLDAGARADQIEAHSVAETAIRRGLEIAGPGDALVILGSPEVVLPTLGQGIEA